ncbi:glycosyltransferase [Sphingomonas sp. CA1-15]|uniref:Glycosyltransferase n=1 Tax=Sphingomonas immobilis TaxID=3063997 RepID=A0ABT9A2C7_9SPHN|nr:glycosyltransferase [Sphingomonas sp. CA1-15]
MLSPRPPAAHILAYAQTLDGGGVERALMRLMAGWSDLGRRVTLVLGDNRGPLAGELPAGVDTVLLGNASMRGLLALPALVEEIGPDLVFCAGNHYSGIAAWTRLRLGRRCPPIVAKVSNALERRDQAAAVAMVYRAWLRLHPLFLDRLVAMTPGMRSETVRAMGVDADILSVIPNPPVRLTRGGDGDCPEGRYLLGVGRLAPQKRWDRLIRAFARVRDPGVTLVILGEGEERPALEALVADLGLSGRVLMPGYAADPLPMIERATALALVSEFEGVPGVLREALAVGTPVISTESSVAVREIVAGPRLGTVVAQEDHEGLVRALHHWLGPRRRRPAPVAQPGEDAAAAYLDVFDEVVLDRRFNASRARPRSRESHARNFAPARP